MSKILSPRNNKAGAPRGPAIIIRGDGQRGDSTDQMAMGQTWSRPNIVLPGGKVEGSVSGGIGGLQHYHLVAEGSRLDISSGNPWSGLLGLIVRHGNGWAGDKSEVAIFFRTARCANRLEGIRYGAVVEGAKWYCVALNEMNSKAQGQRMDALVNMCLSLAVGSCPSRNDRLQCIQAVSRSFEFFGEVLFSRVMKLHLLHMIEREWRARGFLPFNNQMPIIDRNGRRGVTRERLNGEMQDVWDN